MVSTRAALIAALPCVAAWSAVADLKVDLTRRDDVEPPFRAPTFNSGRSNLGTAGILPASFNEQEQFVDVSEGSGHEFQAPQPEDLRGQCPGLNAAANHGYLPRNGIATIAQTISGLGDLYNMAPDLCLFLAVISIGFSGDILTGTWSIGGAFPSSLSLLGEPQGIAGTHNEYESDSSIVRGDAYMHDGNVGVFEMRRWEHFYNMSEEFTMDHAAAQADYNTRWSVLNNPYYFAGPFSVAVASAAHNFVINLMSNHSAEAPTGVLTRDVLKSFFAVTGEPGSFVHTPGMERIPENWYRRPTLNAYDLPETVADVFISNLMYPGTYRIGGNTGTVDTFTGFELGDVTDGLYSLDTILEGNNAACFLLSASLAGMSDQASPLLGAVGSVLGFVTDALGPLGDKLGCPQLAALNNELFDQLPGYKYKAQGQK